MLSNPITSAWGKINFPLFREMYQLAFSSFAMFILTGLTQFFRSFFNRLSHLFCRLGSMHQIRGSFIRLLIFFVIALEYEVANGTFFFDQYYFSPTVQCAPKRTRNEYLKSKETKGWQRQVKMPERPSKMYEQFYMCISLTCTLEYC